MSDYFKNKTPISSSSRKKPKSFFERKEEIESQKPVITQTTERIEREEGVSPEELAKGTGAGLPLTEERVSGAAAKVAESISLGTLDNLLGMASPEAAERFRSVVEKFEKESPAGSLAIDLAAPNPLSALSKAGTGASILSRLMKKYGPEAATSVATQAGYEGEVSVPRVIGETAGGKLLEKGVDVMARGRPYLRRADTLGIRTGADMKKVRRKYKGRMPEEFLQETIEGLEDTGLFKSGQVNFNPNTLKFESKLRPTGGDTTKLGPSFGTKIDSAVSEAAFPPSKKEIYQRVKKAKDKTGKRIQQILESRSPKIKKSLGIQTPPVPGSGVLNKESILEHNQGKLKDLMNEPRVGESSYVHEVEESLERLFRNSDEVTLQDLDKEKRRLYDSLKTKDGQWPGTPPSNESVRAREDAARIYKDIINNQLEDTDIRKLNEAYETFSLVEEPLLRKMETGTFSSASEDAVQAAQRGTFFGPGLYRGARVAETVGKMDEVLGASSQLGMALRKNPELQQYLRGKGAQTIPYISKEINEATSEEGGSYDFGDIDRSPQSIPTMDRINNLPYALQNSRLPRTTQGILENRQLVLAKVAQEVPEMFAEVKRVINERPQDIDRLLPQLIQVMPKLFEPDEYGRVDGKILDPNTKMRAIDEVYSDPDLSNTEKVELVDRLMKTGKLEGYK